MSDGSVWACGWNDRGQLGRGTTASAAVPVWVAGPPRARPRRGAVLRRGTTGRRLHDWSRIGDDVHNVEGENERHEAVEDLDRAGRAALSDRAWGQARHAFERALSLRRPQKPSRCRVSLEGDLPMTTAVTASSPVAAAKRTSTSYGGLRARANDHLVRGQEGRLRSGGPWEAETIARVRLYGSGALRKCENLAKHEPDALQGLGCQTFGLFLRDETPHLDVVDRPDRAISERGEHVHAQRSFVVALGDSAEVNDRLVCRRDATPPSLGSGRKPECGLVP